jgi:aminoglycoside phosphotransferase (APT) family kinase protein
MNIHMAIHDVDIDAMLDRARLQAWLDENTPELGSGCLKIGLLHGGTSNVILSLDRGGRTAVLRRTPPDPPRASIKAIEREATILTALNDTPVPTPHVYGKCFDPEVMGSSFYVMERVDGWAPELNDRTFRFNAPFDREPLKPQLPHAMIDGLIQLAKVDYKAAGLEDFGKPDGFLERQVDRWGQQLESYKSAYRKYQGREIPGLEHVADWLRHNTPQSGAPAIIHGDYGFHNVMFANEPRVRLAAIIDWELATIGDPLVDIGWFLGAFRDAREPGVVPASTYFDPFDFPTRQELAARFVEGTGRNIDCLDYYLVLALYKGACIFEYKVAAAMDGLLSGQIGEMFGKLVLDNIREAQKIVRWHT